MLDFNTDYDRANPLTDEEATLNYLKKIEQGANLEKLKLRKRQTIMEARHDQLLNYVKRETMMSRAGIYLRHNRSTVQFVNQVGSS